VRFNGVVLRLIDSPARRLMPSGLTQIAYTGPVSGETVRLPVYSVAEGSRFLVVAGRPEHKRWWRTFRHPRLARLTRAGRCDDVVGQILAGSDRVSALAVCTAAQSSSRRGIDASTPVIAFTRSARAEPGPGWSAGQEVGPGASPPIEELR
jgi:hypothetical protein